MAANYGNTLPTTMHPTYNIHNVLIILHPKRAVLFPTSAAQAMRTSHEACGKGSSASFAGLSVSPFSCGGAQLQSPTAADLLWASSPAFLGITPSAGGLTRPYSSEYTPQQSGPLLFPAQQLFLPSRSPLPRDLSWADPDRLWEHLKNQDSHQLAPETDLKRRHPGLTATMRSILLDWILEASYCPSPSHTLIHLPLLHPRAQVCEVYRLHRESFYLAVDLYDRFLDSQYSIPKESLQKIGVTCLFAAAKIEVCTKHSSCVRAVMCEPIHFVPISGNLSTKG